MDELIKPIFEFLFYKLGKFIASILFPHIAPPSDKEPKPSWKAALTYKSKQKRHFYTETLMFIGLLFTVLVIGAIVLIYKATS